MALKIVKKKNSKEIKAKRTAIISILGTLNKSEALYSKESSISLEIKSGKYKNMLPLLFHSFNEQEDTTLISIYTKEALEIQKEVLPNFNIEENGYLIEENKFDEIFNTINIILSDTTYTDFIVDISHGFRHLPILTTVSMLISNFQDSSKIKNILFAKEIKKFEEYEIIDLKPYLEIANIAFVLNTFDDNYTVAHHINSYKYATLIKALNDFSNDIMALNLSNLNNSSLPTLLDELNNIEDISIKDMAQQLENELKNDFSYEDKIYLTFYKISKNIFEKNYILLSLSLLYESIRIFIKTSIKRDEKAIVLKLEEFFKNDIYKLGNFFKNLDWKSYDKLKSEKDIISSFEYDKLISSYKRRILTPSLIKDISDTRNDLSHANSKMKFAEIKTNTLYLIERYESQYNLKEKLKSNNT